MKVIELSSNSSSREYAFYYFFVFQEKINNFLLKVKRERENERKSEFSKCKLAPTPETSSSSHRVDD